MRTPTGEAQKQRIEDLSHHTGVCFCHDAFHTWRALLSATYSNFGGSGTTQRATDSAQQDIPDEQSCRLPPFFERINLDAMNSADWIQRWRGGSVRCGRSRCHGSIRGCWTQWWGTRNPGWATCWHSKAIGMSYNLYILKRNRLLTWCHRRRTQNPNSPTQPRPPQLLLNLQAWALDSTLWYFSVVWQPLVLTSTCKASRARLRRCWDAIDRFKSRKLTLDDENDLDPTSGAFWAWKLVSITRVHLMRLLSTPH
jgi:hypothetical protein